MKKLVWPGILAGILFLAFGFVMNFIFSWVFPSHQAIYENTQIFVDMASSRAIFFFLYPIVLGIALAWLFTIVKKEIRKPLTFAGLHFMISSLPMFFINVGSFSVPIMMIVSWVIMSYADGLIAGLLFNKMLK